MGVLLLALLQMSHAQSMAPSPAADAPMNHGKCLFFFMFFRDRFNVAL